MPHRVDVKGFALSSSVSYSFTLHPSWIKNKNPRKGFLSHKPDRILTSYPQGISPPYGGLRPTDNVFGRSHFIASNLTVDPRI